MKFFRRSWPYFMLALTLLVAGLLFWQHSKILDIAAIRGYQPASEVSQLVNDTAMTPYGQRLFYVNRPAIEDKDAFNEHCTDNLDQVATLGCYRGNRQGIYIYNVTDPRLAGVEQVTAAHEMLHQAYDRLSKSERRRIDDLLQKYNDTGLSDPIIKDQINSYRQTEPDQLLNEMHSIFGTEIQPLPPELEQYYELYFKDRQKTVGLYSQYRAEFDKRRKQVEDYDRQLTDMKSQIETHKNNLSAKESTLKTKREQLDKYIDNDQIVAYNEAVPAFNAMVGDYRAEVGETNSLINQYNKILDDRNAIAVQERELQKALDSHVQNAE